MFNLESLAAPWGHGSPSLGAILVWEAMTLEMLNIQLTGALIERELTLNSAEGTAASA